MIPPLKGSLAPAGVRRTFAQRGGHATTPAAVSRRHQGREAGWQPVRPQRAGERRRRPRHHRCVRTSLWLLSNTAWPKCALADWPWCPGWLSILLHAPGAIIAPLVIQIGDAAM